ncbi:UNVERIFIED_CONTAM: hypothetical protein FKN15_054135 [Acipenser sinensis]
MRRNSPCRFYLPNPQERQSQCDTPFRVPSKNQPTSHSQDANLRCSTHSASTSGVRLSSAPRSLAELCAGPPQVCSTGTACLLSSRAD